MANEGAAGKDNPISTNGHNKDASAIKSTTEVAHVDRDPLKQSISFKGNSLEAYQRATDQVRQLEGKSITFPQMPHRLNPIVKPFNSERPSQYHGRLSQSEAVAVNILAQENSAMFQAFQQEGEASKHLQDALNAQGKGQVYWLIDGMSSFGEALLMTTGVRERLLNGLQTPKVVDGDFYDSHHKEHWDTYAEPLQKDGFVIGQNTVQTITENINDGFNRFYKGSQQSELAQENRKEGAVLARDIYLEALYKAQIDFPDKLAPKPQDEINKPGAVDQAPKVSRLRGLLNKLRGKTR